MGQPTFHYLIRSKGQVAGPYTIGQVLNLWRNGQIVSTAEFANNVNNVWRPVTELRLDEPEADSYNLPMIWTRLQAADPTLFGPLSLNQMRTALEEGLNPMDSWFWWAGLAQWINAETFITSQAVFPLVISPWGDAIYNPQQITPPPLSAQSANVANEAERRHQLHAQLVANTRTGQPNTNTNLENQAWSDAGGCFLVLIFFAVLLAVVIMIFA